jgi:LmbE family N-acetylglucosaminyl deacetylase
MPTLRARYDALYLSPHLDDVALSCGGSVAAQVQRGETVLVVTIAAGDPPPGPLSPLAETMHASWNLGRDAVERRRAEDRAACARLGADWVHLPIPDCIYRLAGASGKWRCASRRDIFGPLHPQDEELLAAIVARLAALPPANRLVAPLGIGGHVDHQLGRRAAEACAHPSLGYYADQPYCARDPAFLKDWRARPDWSEDRVRLDEAGLAAKLAAVRAYVSQVTKLYPAGFEKGSPGRRTLRGESFWRKRGVVLC